MDRVRRRLSSTSTPSPSPLVIDSQFYYKELTGNTTRGITKPQPAINRRRSSCSNGGLSSLSTSTLEDDDSHIQLTARNSYRRYSDETLKDESSILTDESFNGKIDSNSRDMWENIDLSIPEPHSLHEDDEIESPKSPNYLMHHELVGCAIDRVVDDVDMTLNRVRASAATVVDVASIMIGVDNEVIRLENEKKDDDADTLLDVPLSLSREQGRRRQSAFEQNLDEIITRLSAKKLQMSDQHDPSRLQIPTTRSPSSTHSTSRNQDFSPRSATAVDGALSRFSWTHWTKPVEKQASPVPASPASPHISSPVNMKLANSCRKSISNSRNSQEFQSVTKPSKVLVINIGKRDKGTVQQVTKEVRDPVTDSFWDLDVVVGKLQSPVLGRLDNQRVAMRSPKDKTGSNMKDVPLVSSVFSTSNTLPLHISGNEDQELHFPASSFKSSESTPVADTSSSGNLKREIPPRSASLNRLYLAEALYGHPAPVTSRSVVPVTPPPRAVLDPDHIIENQVIWELDDDGLSFRRKVVITRPRKSNT